MKDVLELAPASEGECWWMRFGERVGRRTHHHDELELNLVRKGHATYVVEDRRYDLEPQTLIWLFPEQEHVLLEDSADYEMWIAVFRPRLVSRLCEGTARTVLTEGAPLGSWSRHLAASEAELLGRVMTDVAPVEGDPALHNTALAYVLVRAWQAFTEADAVNEGVELHVAVERAVHLLRKPGGGAQIGDVARRAGMSRSRLSALFREQTGQTMVEYRQRQMLNEFLRIYGAGRRKTATEAAYEAGFGSYAQFHRVFKRIMGRAPAKYKRDRG
jgi:AraC-like DNA-binding protein